jgi:hypothetical protein
MNFLTGWAGRILSLLLIVAVPILIGVAEQRWWWILPATAVAALSVETRRRKALAGLIESQGYTSEQATAGKWILPALLVFLAQITIYAFTVGIKAP